MDYGQGSYHIIEAFPAAVAGLQKFKLIEGEVVGNNRLSHQRYIPSTMLNTALYQLLT